MSPFSGRSEALGESSPRQCERRTHSSGVSLGTCFIFAGVSTSMLTHTSESHGPFHALNAAGPGCCASVIVVGNPLFAVILVHVVLSPAY